MVNPEIEGAPKRAKPISSSSSSSPPLKLVKRIHLSSSMVSSTEPLVRCESYNKLKYEGYGDKSLFLCSYEGYRPAYVSPSRPEGPYQPWDGCYAVLSISLRDLLTSSDKLELRKLASVSDKDLAGQVGCGVFGSKIVIAGGMKPNLDPNRIGSAFGPKFSPDAYAFDTDDPQQGLVKMAGALNGGKVRPSVFEFGGKLFALSCQDRWSYGEFVSFEVFDPEQATWSLLPSFPEHKHGFDSYAVAGSRLYVFSRTTSIWCFELAAQDPEWRRCGPFPFTFKGQGRSLVVDKLLFSVEPGYWTKLVVHLMSTPESLTEIVEMTLPTEPELVGCRLFHPGGNLICLVTTGARQSTKKPRGFYTVRGSVLPIQFEFDISKVHTDKKNCFTVQFHSPRRFKYHTGGPDCNIAPFTLGCFVL